MDTSEPEIQGDIQIRGVVIENKIQAISGVDAERSLEVIENEHEFNSSKASPFGKIQQGVQKELFLCGNPSDSSVDKSQVAMDLEGCQTTEMDVDKCNRDNDGEHVCHSPDIHAVNMSESGFASKDEVDTYLVPQVGMEFESEDHAYKCYSRYAVSKGFSIRKDFVNKSRINGAVVSRRYTCYRQGYRPAKQKSNARKARQETRTGCLAHMTIARQPNGKFRATHFETNHNHEFVTSLTAHMLPSQKRLTFAQAVENELAKKCEMDGKPKLGMAFESEDHAYEFYNAYAGQVGFSVRKDYVNRSKIDGAVASRRFTCFREGFRQRDKRDGNAKRPRKETRIGCLAQLVISRQPDSKYRVTHFEEKHNHELVAACRVGMLRSQKRSAVAQFIEGSVVKSSKIEVKSVCELISNIAADGTGHRYDSINFGSRLISKRRREMRVEDAGKMQHYFWSKQSKNPSFFYAMQHDAEDQITNLFWADTRMIEDYGDFGDLICFDTTYRLHEGYQPFASFVGVNHHKQMVIFGAAFLFDETIESFKWLFRTFIHAMSGKKPKTILTDRDIVMVEAINLEMPETHHRFCVWQLYENAVKQLSHIAAQSSSFVNDLACCFFDHEEEDDFISSWKLMLSVCSLWENEWLNEIYGCREKWANAYGRRTFCADIKRTLLCENLTAKLRKYLRPESDVLSFLKHLEKVVNEWHYKELEATYEMGQHMPRLMGDVIMLKQARNIYTPKMFELFQQEYETCLNIVINQLSESDSLIEYRVNLYEQLRKYAVIFNASNDTVACSCMKFEFMGILCSHALKVLDYRNIKLLPAQYILKRWTKDARV